VIFPFYGAVIKGSEQIKKKSITQRREALVRHIFVEKPACGKKTPSAAE
jgi:hypothetical protein